MFLTVFLSDLFFDFLEFFVGWKKMIKLGNFTTKSIYVAVLSSRGRITYFKALLLDKI